jgi:hypothetical protein
MVVLHKKIADAKLTEFGVVVGFHERTTRVAKDFRAQFPDARE